MSEPSNHLNTLLQNINDRLVEHGRKSEEGLIRTHERIDKLTNDITDLKLMIKDESHMLELKLLDQLNEKIEIQRKAISKLRIAIIVLALGGGAATGGSKILSMFGL